MARDIDRKDKKTDIEVAPGTIFVRRRIVMHSPETAIVVIDEKTQRMFPSLVVSPTATVQKQDIGLLMNSEPDRSSSK